MVCDPNADEEALISTSLTLLLDGNGEMVVTHKPERRAAARGEHGGVLGGGEEAIAGAEALVQQ